jgi:hypothetical protein
MRVEPVLAAVDLDDEALTQADEIDDRAGTGSLLAKMVALLPQLAEAHPELHLLRGHALAQRPRVLVRHRFPRRKA